MNTTNAKFKYFDVIMASFVAILLISNTVGGKIVHLFGQDMSAGYVIFPISYIFGDVLTEVYGYRASRKVIWTGLSCLALMSLLYLFVQALPPASFWAHQSAYEAILGFAPRLALGSILAYFCGEFCNSYVLAKLKVATEGKFLAARTIGSTLVGEGVDTVVVYLVAFAGVFPWAILVKLAATGYCVKVIYEVLATPLTYLVVGWLKKAEGCDVYDRNTDFNPFHLTGCAKEK